ncbi:MAG: hypothetical protein R3277_05125 [Brumimicrobium sp.]|nr:hypothetical protein [Brumimicrobium sp.]
MKKCVFLLIFLVNLSVFAQTDFQPTGSFKVEIALPNNATNIAFRDQLQGLVALTPSYQHTFGSTFSVGAGLRYSYFNVNQFKNNVGLSGGMHIAGVFGKIGQEKFYGNFGLDYGVRAGYALNISTTNKLREAGRSPHIFDGGFVEPTIGLALMADERSSFRLALSYAFHGFTLKPGHLGLDDFSGYPDDKLDRFTSFFCIGFGYSYYFGIN